MTKQERDALRAAFADYKGSEGCSCCQNTDAHDEANERMWKLLGVRKKDGWYDYTKFKSEK